MNKFIVPVALLASSGLIATQAEVIDPFPPPPPCLTLLFRVVAMMTILLLQHQMFIEAMLQLVMCYI
jgi:hypothetical protein